MKLRLREAAFLFFGAIIFALFCKAVSELPVFGRFAGWYGVLVNAVTVPLRHVTNVPSAINYDFRGLDTMGEEYIVFGSVIGTIALLRQMRQEMEEAEEVENVGAQRQPSDAVRFFGLVMAGLLVLFGIYIVLHGHLTPGGGFQGGTILGTAGPLMYLTGDYETYAKLSPAAIMEFIHASGAGFYVIIGSIGLAFGSFFLQNVLPFGTVHSFLSGGTIPLINDGVGVEVSFGFAIIFREFLLQTRRHDE